MLSSHKCFFMLESTRHQEKGQDFPCLDYNIVGFAPLWLPLQRCHTISSNGSSSVYQYASDCIVVKEFGWDISCGHFSAGDSVQG